MGFLDDELSEVKKLFEHKVPRSRLVSCVPSMVRAEIKRTEHKHIVVCAQFPQDYPKVPLLLELKSKTLSDKLLQRLTSVCEQELKKYLGKAQILPLLLFVHAFIEETPLSCCYDEVSAIKLSLTNSNDVLKLRQKSSSIVLKIVNDKYYFDVKIVIPDEYPVHCIKIENVETCFPPAFRRHMVAQANEIARQCAEAPLKPAKNAPPFKPGPSLQPVATFLIDCVKRLPTEKCQYCGEQCFPPDPKDVVSDEHGAKHVERLNCGHLFHLECFFRFMKKPPFGNKMCATCGQRVFHHKWSLSDRLAEDRWAHEQARERELAEVEDFFN